MIIVNQNDFIRLLHDLGYYKDEEFDTDLQGYFNQYDINIIYSSRGKHYALSFLSDQKETLFRIQYSNIL